MERLYSVKMASNFLVDGNIIRNHSDAVYIRGVSKSGLEYLYIDINSFTDTSIHFDIQLMYSWGINCLRIPLRDKHWLDPAYIDVVNSFIFYAFRFNMIVILDLHLQGGNKLQDKSMLRRNNTWDASKFWYNVSRQYHEFADIFFEVFNEPNNIDPITWWYGDEEFYGYKEILQVIRANADNICILGGLDYAYQWAFLREHPDILHEMKQFTNLVVSSHPYGYKGAPILPDGIFSYPVPVRTIIPTADYTGDCTSGITVPEVDIDQYGWNQSFGYLYHEEHFPMIVTEWGLDRPDTAIQGGWYTTHLLSYMSRHKMNYIAWAWVPDRIDYPSLLSRDFSPSGGSPCGTVENNYYRGPGYLFHDHLKQPRRILYPEISMSNTYLYTLLIIVMYGIKKILTRFASKQTTRICSFEKFEKL